MSFWIKCSPIIADWSLNLVFPSQEKKILSHNLKTKEHLGKKGQNWPKHAIRVMRILPRQQKVPWVDKHKAKTNLLDKNPKSLRTKVVALTDT